jgi:hypothetical protein
MNLPEKLAREIHRVTVLRTQYVEAERLVRADAHVNVAPAIVLIDIALETAMTSAGSFDPMAQIDAIADLGRFQS